MKWNSYTILHYIDEVLEFADWDKEPKDILNDLAIAIINEFDLGDIKFNATPISITLYDVSNPFTHRLFTSHWLSEKAQYQTCFETCVMSWHNGYDYSTGSSVNIRNTGEPSRLSLIFQKLEQPKKPDLERMKRYAENFKRLRIDKIED